MAKRVQLLIGLLVLGLLVVGAWGMGQKRQAQAATLALEMRYNQAFYDLLGNVEAIQGTMGKALVSGSPAHRNALLAEVWRRADAAQANLAQLPLSNISMVRTQKFLNQVADYSFILTRGGRESELDSRQEEENLKRLFSETRSLSSRLNSLQGDLARQRFRWQSVENNAAQTKLSRTNPDPIGDGFSQIETDLTNVPGLIYDGPFSDHITEATQSLNQPPVSVTVARQRAVEFLDKPGNQISTAFKGLTDGLLDVYSFEIAVEGSRYPYAIDVSREGGHVVSMLRQRPIGQSTVEPGETVAVARDFLERRGFSSLENTGILTQGGEVVVAFAAVEEEVLLYPDQVKVKVALDNREVTGFEVWNYLVSHHPRNLPRPQITKAEAQKSLNSNLELEGSRLALIPLPGGREVLTWEFRGTFSGQRYFVYINAQTGEEEQVLQQVDAPQGDLTL
jgi:germination protein YpeB